MRAILAIVWFESLNFELYLLRSILLGAGNKRVHAETACMYLSLSASLIAVVRERVLSLPCPVSRTILFLSLVYHTSTATYAVVMLLTLLAIVIINSLRSFGSRAENVSGFIPGVSQRRRSPLISHI